ncbi:hypothetical protein MD484_g2736, partial [Candolleomyces efflorescens]
MRFTALTVILSCIALSYAHSGGSEDFAARSTDSDVVLNARELLEDLGMHARALKGAALSARRIEDLEARMFDLESDIEELVVRAKKSNAYVCPVCDATFDSTKALTSHKDSAGHHRTIAPAANSRRRK